MVDEVEIKNVGRNGVASEATLLELKKTFDEMAKAQGINTKKINDDLDELAKKTGKAKENLTTFDKAVAKASDSLKDMPKKAFDAFKDSLTGLAGELATGSTRISDFAGHMPAFGREFSTVTSLLDNSFETFQNLASSGATFGYSLSELRSQVVRSGLSFSDYSNIISSSSEDLASFGGTVAQGARQTNQLLGALGDQREQLLSLGATQEELNDSLIFYQTLNRTGALAERRSAREQADAAGDLTKNMLALSKLTGDDLKSQKEKIAQAQMDTAFQRERLKLLPQNQDKLDQLVQEAALAGPEAVNAVKAQFLGMPPLTEGAQIFAATQQEVFQEIGRSMATVRDDRVTFTQFEADRNQRLLRLAEDINTAQNRLDPLLKVGALDGSGVAGMIAEQSEPGINFIGAALENVGGQIVLDTEAMSERINEAFDRDTGDEVKTMAEFRESIRKTRESLNDNLVEPFVDNKLEPALDSITSKLKEVADSKGLENIANFAADNPLLTAGGALGASKLPEILGMLGGGYALKRVLSRRGSSKAAPTSAPDTSTPRSSTIVDKNGRPIDLSDDDKNTSRRSGKFTGALKNIGRKLPYVGYALTALFDVADTAATLSDTEATTQEKATDIGGTAGGLGMAALGTKAGGAAGALGGPAAPITVPLGMAVGGGLGYLAGSDLGQFIGHHLFGGDKEQENAEQAQNLQDQPQHPRVSDAHLSSLERLVGFAPQVRILSNDIQSLEKTFNSLDLNYRHIDRTTRSLEKLESMSTLESKFRALSDYLTTDSENTDQISEKQIQSLQSLVGLEPKLQNLSGSISGFQQEFNSLDLNYREVDRTTRSLEKMAEQLEEINTQLQGGEEGFLDKMNPLSGNNEDNTTAGDLLSGSGLGSSDNVEKLNRTMQDILGVLMASNDVNRKQLGAARSMTADLYRGF